jgi:hypothetical protein
MAIKSYGATPLRSNGEAPNALNRKIQPAASLPGLGLAGVESVVIHVKAEGNPSQKLQVGPAVTVKAADLPEIRQTGADEPGFDLKPEHPKLGSMPNVNHIGFLPRVHWSLTFHAALDAGLPFGKALELAHLVVEVDNLPDSQDPGHSFMHHMRGPGETMEHFNVASETYKATLRAMKNMRGLAGLLHLDQDSRSKSHTGPQGQPLEWHGSSNERILHLLWHVWEDKAPGSDVELAAIQNGTALIKEYIYQCGGSL